MIAATVCGNLGKDAELKMTPGGKAVCNFSVATEARVGREKVTTWVRCAMWGVRAEKVAKFLTKGTKVAAMGTLTTREYQGKTYLDCDVSEVALMGGGQREGEASQDVPRNRDAAGGGTRGPQQTFDRGPSDDEIPF